MKPVKKTLKSLTAVALLTGLSMNFNACSEQQSPLNSETQIVEQMAAADASSRAVFAEGPLSAEQVNAITAPKEKIQVAENDLKILKTKSGVSLQKRFVSSWYVPLGAYGWAYAGDNEHGRCWLYFPQYAMNQTTTVTLDWESTGFLQGGAEFSPHGVQFNTPVTLWISYKDADLGDINEQDLKLWNFNEATSMWELIGDVVDTQNKMVGGLLHHFSRYAISAE